MRFLKAVLAFAAASVLGMAAPASATGILYITDGITGITITDGGVGDSCLSANCVTFNGSIGVWTISVSTGITNISGPNMGIDLNTTDQSSDAGTLQIYYGDTDFTLGAGTHGLNYTENIGGTTHGQVFYDSCVSDNNTNAAPPPHSGCSYIAGLDGPLVGPAFATSDGHSTTVTDTFGLTQYLKIVHTSASNTSLDYEIHIPEPGTLLLFGASLMGLALVRRRKS